MAFGLNGITAFLLGISTQLILVYALFRQWFRFSTQTTLLVVAALKTMELCANEIVTDETRWILAILATLQTPLLIPLMKKGMRRLMLIIYMLYAFIYNNEVVHEAKLVVVDQSDTYLSRDFIRRVDATADVRVVSGCSDMREARRLLDEKKAYGILEFPVEFSKDVHKGKQTTVSLYCDMSSLLFYKAFLLAATEVSLEMGAEIRAHNQPASTAEMERIAINPIPYESVGLFNSQNGFASFLVPAILALLKAWTMYSSVQPETTA